jgi:hypothetical protein
MRFKNSGAANRILETPGELFAAARGENALFPVLIQVLFKRLKVFSISEINCFEMPQS